MFNVITLLTTLIGVVACAHAPENVHRYPEAVAEANPKSTSARQIGGPCEGCEAVYEYGDRDLAWSDTLEDFSLAGTKIVVSGTIYQSDGKTPAPGVILYVYHTDQSGHYTANHGETNWGRRHGSLRTWLRTDNQGRYLFYTLRPASYPQSKIPAHIHAFLKEPGKSPYWIDDYRFDDDPFLTKEERSQIRGRGGNTGILKGSTQGDIVKYTRDITLGLNVDGWY